MDTSTMNNDSGQGPGSADSSRSNSTGTSSDNNREGTTPSSVSTTTTTASTPPATTTPKTTRNPLNPEADASTSGTSATSTVGLTQRHRPSQNSASSSSTVVAAGAAVASSSLSSWPKTSAPQTQPSPSKSTQSDPHNNGARAALTNEIRAEFFRLYEQSGFQVPGLSPQNILRHKDKDLHFEGHEGLRDFWKQSAASRREILQLAREGHIRVVRGPPPVTSPASHSVESTPPVHHQLPPPPTESTATTPHPPTSRKRSSAQMTTSSATSSESGSSSSKRQQSYPIPPNVTDEWLPGVDWGQQRVGVGAVSRLVHTLQNALDDYASPPSAGSNTSVSSHGGGNKSRVEEERDAALARIAVLERERDDALAARDQALKIAEESYRELRAVVDSRFRRIRELTDAGGAVGYD